MIRLDTVGIAVANSSSNFSEVFLQARRQQQYDSTLESPPCALSIELATGVAKSVANPPKVACVYNYQGTFQLNPVLFSFPSLPARQMCIHLHNDAKCALLKVSKEKLSSLCPQKKNSNLELKNVRKRKAKKFPMRPYLR